MSTPSPHPYLPADARKAIAESRLQSALESLRGMAQVLNANREAEELNALATGYEMMLDYFRRGAADPERSALYESFLRRAEELSFRLEREGKLRTDTQSFYTTTFRTLQHLRPDQPTMAGMLADTTAPRDLFDFLWTSPLLSQADEDRLTEYLSPSDGTEAPLHCRALALSALTLSAMQYFDIAKCRLLLDACLSSEVTLRVRGLVGLVMVSIFHSKSMQRYPELMARMELLTEADGIQNALELIQTQLFLSLTTRHIEESLRQKLLPEIEKHVEKLHKARKLGIEELTGTLSEMELNPEWEQNGKPSPMAEYIREYTQLLQRGGDLYLGMFKALKPRFPFFNVTCNWFWPFTPDHPDLDAQACKDNRLGFMSYNLGLCDTDKFAFCLMASMFKNLSNKQDSMSRALSEELQKRLAEAEDNLPREAESPDFNEALRSYVHGFYRFSNLFIHREAFPNPFKENLLLAEQAPFARLLSHPNFMRRMGEYAFQDKSFALAQLLFEHIAPQQRTPEDYQKLGYCAEKNAQPARALEAYLVADSLKPHSAWTVRRMATLYRAGGDYDKALQCFDELAGMQPEDGQIALRQAECLIQLKRFDEAFKFLFKANYLLPDGAMTERALAWCSLLTKKYEQAETYYAKVLAHEPTAADYLNAGHAAWLQGMVALAVERYRKATACSPSEGDFLQDDLPLLREAGLTEIEIALMRDAVAQTHP